MQYEETQTWKHKLRPRLTVALAILALVLSVTGLATSVQASNAAAKEANNRAAAAEQSIAHERATHCGFYTAVGGFPTDQLQPTTPTGDAFKRQFVGTVEAAKLASKNLGCPSSVSTPKVP